MIRALSAIEILVASLLTLAAAVLFANSYFCFFNRGACGMVEPILAAYALMIAIPLMLAGWLHYKRRIIPGVLAYIPVVAIVVVLVGHAQLWW